MHIKKALIIMEIFVNLLQWSFSIMIYPDLTIIYI